MLNLRLVEIPAPAGSRDVDQLVAWMVDTLDLVRRKGDEWTGDGMHSPMHRLLRDYLLAEPTAGWDAQALGDELGLSATAIHHQLVKLQESGLTDTTQREGWRVHHLRNGSIANAVALAHAEARLVLEQRLGALESWMVESDARMTIPAEKGDEAALRLVVRPRAPLIAEQDEKDAWLADLGLYGDRIRKPKDGGKPLAREIFEHLCSASAPISLDEALTHWGTTRPRLTRTFERFRAAGMAERVPRLDRLPVTLWTALKSQHSRRGPDWLLTKGGLSRMDSKVADAVLAGLEAGDFTVESCESIFDGVEAKSQMLLLNLLGGKLPTGWRLSGSNAREVREKVLSRLDRAFRRLHRVGDTLESL